MPRRKKLETWARKKYKNNPRSCEIGKENRVIASNPSHGMIIHKFEYEANA